MTSTTSKPSTGSDTDTKTAHKNRWFRYKLPQADLPEIEHIFDFYWSGSERRITGLTLRIISVNAIALIILVLGILYLGQYQDSVIETKLQKFKDETQIIATSLETSAIENDEKLSIDTARALLNGYTQTINKDFLLFDLKNQNALNITADPAMFTGGQREFRSINILKSTARFILDLMPDKNTLPLYPDNINLAPTLPDFQNAENGQISLSAWQDKNDKIILSAGIPITHNNALMGILLIKDRSHNIEESIGRVWADILRIFLGTLLITTLLSIYLSGVIAFPLKKLAKAAENIRTGRAKTSDIPDFSHRNDEIGDLSIALKSMITALWDRMDSIDNFAADVAHELKNPLTSLKSALEAAQRVKKKSDKDKLMQIINHDIERMDRLITDISSASRLDAELSREAFASINITQLIERSIDFYRQPLKRGEAKNPYAVTCKNDVTIRMDIQLAETLTVMGIEDRLAQVFRNLLDNALSFAPKGSSITITIAKHKKNAQIKITDEGHGIPQSKLETIFERFYTERPEESYGQNSGLGLSICKQIIDAHDGKIVANNITDNNENTSGAEFTIILKTAL